MSFYVVKRLSLMEFSVRIGSSNASRSAVANGLVVICLSSLLTVSNAFQTQELGLIHQLSLWLTVCVLLVIQLGFIQSVLTRRLGDSFTAKAMAGMLAIFATVVLMTLELHWLKFTPLLPKKPDPFLDFLLFVAPPVVSISLIVIALRVLSKPVRTSANDYVKSKNKKEISKPDDSEIQLKEIIENNRVLHVMSQDHYLEITCVEGKHFIRARMKDALIYLKGHSGILVHRSHWIAHEFLQRKYRQGRDYRILLGDGTNIPVARSRAQQIRQLSI